MKRIISVLLVMAVVLCMLCLTSVAESPLNVKNIVLADVEDNDSLATLSFQCNAAEDVTYLTVLLTSVEVTAGMAEIAFDDIVHVDQVKRAANGIYSFTINKTRIPKDAGSLYLRVGGTAVSEPSAKVISMKQSVKGDCSGDGSVDAVDLLTLRQYLAGFAVTIDLDAANVDSSDEVVDAKDLLKLRKYLAGLISSLD